MSILFLEVWWNIFEIKTCYFISFFRFLFYWWILTQVKRIWFWFWVNFIPDSFDFNSSSFPEATNWANCLDKFNELNPNKIKIMHLNINSVFCKLHELNIILNKLLFDFVFIQESKLCPELPDAFISNTNYGLIRRDRRQLVADYLFIIKNRTQF